MCRLPFYAKRPLFTTIILSTCSLYIIILNFTEISNKKPSNYHHRQPHLLENECKFAWTESLDSTLKKRLKFPKTAKCDRYNVELFERIAETGEFITNAYNSSDVTNCTVEELVGGLWPNAHSYHASQKESFPITENQTFWINADNFLITCFENSSILIYKKAFMGLKMPGNSKLFINESFEYSMKNEKYGKSERFSVSIMVFDSTSRAQFRRHMRKTSELMENMGTIVFEAYNKVGDNSAVNMLPILAEPLNETKDFSTLDETGDINIQKILPSKVKLIPDKIRWIWKKLPPEYVTMFNDDIMHTSRGLFHYPNENFKAGFSHKPTDYYYRPFYNYLYTRLNNFWRKCLDGDLLAEQFIDSWFRFENVFSNSLHFGFTFMASLTHDDPNNLNYLDDVVFNKLDFLKKGNKLSNTFLIIMGDHGNRVHPLNRYTFAGRIEERAPFLSITVPSNFRKKFPEKTRILEENSQRFVSNFDLHETLLEILEISENDVEKRGRSLFRRQDATKNCQQNNVISNHCLCMVDAREDVIKIPAKSKFEDALGRYIEYNELGSCFLNETISCDNPTSYLMPNNYVQVWARTKISDQEVLRKKKSASQIIYTDIKCSIKTTSLEFITLLSRFRIFQDTQSIKIIYHPMITISNICSFYTFPDDYCKCLGFIK